MAQALELKLSFDQPIIGAGLCAAADVAHVNDESELLRVHFVDQDVEALDLGFGVGRVAEQAEGERARGQRREGRATRQQDKKKKSKFRKLCAAA